MTKEIVVGVDGSPTAVRAARSAAELATGLGKELIVVSAYGRFEVEHVRAGADEFTFSSHGEAESVAHRVISTLRTDFSSVSMTALAVEGKPAEALVRTAERLGADVIVVGNKRVQGPKRVLGSIASEVARKAPCDVYIAHTHER